MSATSAPPARAVAAPHAFYGVGELHVAQVERAPSHQSQPCASGALSRRRGVAAPCLCASTLDIGTLILRVRKVSFRAGLFADGFARARRPFFWAPFSDSAFLTERAGPVVGTPHHPDAAFKARRVKLAPMRPNALRRSIPRCQSGSCARQPDEGSFLTAHETDLLAGPVVLFLRKPLR